MLRAEKYKASLEYLVSEIKEMHKQQWKQIKTIGSALKGHPMVKFGAIEAIKIIMMAINTGFKKCVHESTSVIKKGRDDAGQRVFLPAKKCRKIIKL